MKSRTVRRRNRAMAHGAAEALMLRTMRRRWLWRLRGTRSWDFRRHWPAATRDGPATMFDESRCVAEGKPADRDARRKAPTNNAERDGTTTAPARRPARIASDARRAEARAQDRNATASSRELQVDRTSPGPDKHVQQAREDPAGRRRLSGPGKSLGGGQDGPVG